MEYREGDLRLHYEVDGTGPALLFMHGLTADRHQARQCVADLRGFRVITVDLPGHGRSELCDRHPVSDQVGFRAYARLMRGLLKALGITSAFVGGISMGAGVALTMAIDSPQMVRGLLLVRPAWINQPARPHLDLVAEIGRWISAGGEATARHQLVADSRFARVHLSAPSCANGLIETIQRRHVAASPTVLPTMVDDCPYELDSDLERCTMPALVVSGEHDPLHPRAIADHLESGLPRATAHVVSPRYLQAERHGREVATLIETFLRQCTETETNPITASSGGPT